MEPLVSPIAICDGHLSQHETAITIRCHDRLFKTVSVLDASNHLLFTAESKGAGSLTWRRTLKTASGTHLYDLRHYGWALRNKWGVVDPNGKEICSLKHASWLGRERSELFLVGKNRLDGHRDVLLEIHPKHREPLKTVVERQGILVAEVGVVESNDLVSLKYADRSVFTARIAGGVDVALIVAIVLCLAEMEHVWRQSTSYRSTSYSGGLHYNTSASNEAAGSEMKQS